MFRISNLLKDRKALKVVTPHKKKKQSVIQFDSALPSQRRHVSLLTQSGTFSDMQTASRTNICSRNKTMIKGEQSSHFKTISALGGRRPLTGYKTPEKNSRANTIGNIVLSEKDNVNIHNVFNKGISIQKINRLYYRGEHPIRSKSLVNRDREFLLQKRNLNKQFEYGKKEPEEIIENNFNSIFHTFHDNFNENKNYINRYINNELLHYTPSSHKKSSDSKYTKTKIRFFRKNTMLRAIVSYALPKEVNAKVDTIITEEREKAKKDQLKKWISILVPCALHFKRLEIDIKSFYSKKNKTTPYTTKRSYELFLSIKRKDKTKFISLISKHRSIVYDCDHFNQTILHWIAKKDLYDWISFAVHHGAIINSTDSTGRTPLHIACAMNNVKSVMVLLYEMAYPLYRDNQRKAPIELTNDDVIISMLKRDKALYILHSMINGKNFKENIQRALRFLYTEELRTDFSIDKYCIYEK